MSRFHNAPNRLKPVAEAFHEKYAVDNETGCWVWKASFMRTGYGQFNPRNGRIVTAHRFSYELHKGHIPKGMFVCHSCDNRACVNPDHLWIGTPKDNIQDMHKKGRAVCAPRRGQENSASKLTNQQVAEIYTSREPHTKLAKIYHVSPSCILGIKKGMSWSHVTAHLGRPYTPRQKKLTTEDVRAIYLDARKQCEIARDYSVLPNTISRIKSGERHAAITRDLRDSADA